LHKSWLLQKRLSQNGRAVYEGTRRAHFTQSMDAHSVGVRLVG
jgi:hypothetical protein